MPARASLLIWVLAMVGCAPTAPSPTPSVEATRLATATPPPVGGSPADVPPLAGHVLEGVEPGEEPAPTPEIVSQPADAAFQDVLAVAGLVDACDLQSQSLDYRLPDPTALDELIDAAGADPVLSSLLWAGSLESLAAGLDAERVLLDESRDAGWIVYDLDGLPRTASVSRLESASGTEVWAVGLEVSAALPCN